MGTLDSNLLHQLRHTKYDTWEAEESTWVHLSRSSSPRPNVLPLRMDKARSWHPFRPKSGRSSVWFLDSSDLINISECRADYLDVWRLVRAVQYRSTQHPGGSPSHGRPSEVEIPQSQSWPKRLLSLIRDSMADAIGYLTWWEAVTELRGHTKDLKESFQKLNTAQYEKVGVVVDIESDWAGMNIPFWYEQDVSVFYIWRPEFEQIPRLALLNPRLLEQAKQGVIGVNVTRYDELLQEKHVPLPNHTMVQGPYRNQIIDFEGWAPRDITPNMAKTFINRFEYMTRLEGKQAYRVFYRWRPIVSVRFTVPTLFSFLFFLQDYCYSDDEEEEDRRPFDETIHYLREVYRFSNCPRPGQLYDLNTGYRDNVAQQHPAPDSRYRARPTNSGWRDRATTSHGRGGAMTSRGRGVRSYTGSRPSTESASLSRTSFNSWTSVPIDIPSTGSWASQSLGSWPTLESDVPGTRRSGADVSLADSNVGGTWQSVPNDTPTATWGDQSLRSWPDVPVTGTRRSGADVSLADSNVGGTWQSVPNDPPTATWGDQSLGSWPTLESDVSVTGTQQSRADVSPADSSTWKSLPIVPLVETWGNQSLVWPMENEMEATGTQSSGAVPPVDTELATNQMIVDEPPSAQTSAHVEEDTVSLGSPAPEEDRPIESLVAFIESRIAHGTIFAFPDSVPPPPLEWNAQYLKHARLILSPAAEVRLRYFALRHPHLTWSHVLNWALSMCIPFDLVLATRDVELFRPQEVTPSMTANSIHFHGASEQFLRDNVDPNKNFLRWQASCTSLVRRYHARAFLFRGGIVARLAIAFGGGELLRTVASGPSPQLTVNELGKTVPIMGAHQNFRSDSVTDEEVGVLLGTIVSTRGGNPSTFFPPQSIFDDVSFDGQWNEQCEGMFQYIWKHLNHTPKANTSAAWWKLFRPVTNLGQLYRVRKVDSVAWEDVLERMGTRWNGNPLPLSPSFTS
jgi:hypothetical protein